MFFSSLQKCVKPDGSVIYTDKGCEAGSSESVLSVDVSLPDTPFAGKDGMGFSPMHVFLAILAVYMFMSAVNFCLHWIDKKRARKDEWRIPEKTLHSMSLLGGWPGALVAQQAFHHKTRKRSYRWVLAMIITIHGLLWLDYSRGFPVGRAVAAVVYGHVTGLGT